MILFSGCGVNNNLDNSSVINNSSAQSTEPTPTPVSNPVFEGDTPDSFIVNLNAMWNIYGAVNDGTNAVYKFGNEPTYFDWIATKIM